MGSEATPPDFPAHPPEILPPEQGNGAARPGAFGPYAANDPRLNGDPNYANHVAGQAQQPRVARSWAFAPATYLLVGINCAVYLAMVLRGVSFTDPSIDALVHWGANNSNLVLYNGDWWRIISAMFVHVGIIHLAGNMWCLWNLGLLGEPLMGPLGVLAAYLLSGAAGNLLSVGVNQFFGDGGTVGAGASGAVFGLAGVLIVLLKSKRLPIPPKELSGLRRYVIYFAAINFVIGFGGNALGTKVHIDNMAHLGGFLGGIVFALPMVPMKGSSRSVFLLRRRVAVGLLTAVLVFFGVYLTKTFPPEHGPVIEQQ
jgi:rhomboid protease GluP